MKFLLNSKIKIFALLKDEKSDGGFAESEVFIQDFFCSARFSWQNSEEYLTAVLREDPKLIGRMKVVFNQKSYYVVKTVKIMDGFLKLVCK
jgi:hypothetical protein